MSPSFVCFLYDRNVELETPTELLLKKNEDGWIDG